MSYLREHDRHVDRDLFVTFNVIEVTSFLGTIIVETCETCPLMQVNCIHRRTTWVTRTMLTCDLCGMDCT